MSVHDMSIKHLEWAKRELEKKQGLLDKPTTSEQDGDCTYIDYWLYDLGFMNGDESQEQLEKVLLGAYQEVTEKLKEKMLARLAGDSYETQSY